jgi:hypothetical protein
MDINLEIRHNNSIGVNQTHLVTEHAIAMIDLKYILLLAKKIIIVFAIPCAHFGFYTVDSLNDLSGTYTLNVGGGTDVIQLKNDGTYIHDYRNNEAIFSQEGTWTLEHLEAGLTVTLNDFSALPGESIQGRGFYLLAVRKFWGRIYLITNQDLNEGYEKQ